ncbi:hypothetical protein JHK82_045109 [Glycine max]|uniref:Uncharacterized protein n=1 Tax=Glycine soja TaxID=3848 RepID=A0A0B2Q092_GLYSO|nr:uncharacterized protein LOC114390986 [Glycine soja]KAG5100057.1 hypothetical protein JHK82_045109 [Glycine max]KAH1206599.1 hypothetical protein GmHk_16G047001 [Glycine max]KAH1206600.1 hypothetical protein GmHk_16G047001 [Glycine max]KHN13394.1 hypothetical protein glysoja_026824 [Glycine soja]RZB61122.1 hypothetical protein D0Y65_043747 [Glycine soja]
MAGIAILLDLWRKNQNLSSGLHSSHAFQSSSAFFSASAATAAAASFAAGTGFASRALFGSSVAYCDAGAALPEDYISNIQSSFERNYKYDALRYSTKQYNVELKPLFSAFELRAFTLTSLRSFLMFYLPLLEPRAEMEDDEDFLEDDQEHHVDLVVPFRKSVKHIMRETTVVTTRRILERIAVHYVSQRMAWKLLKDIPRSATRKAGRSMPTLVYVYCVSRTTFRGHMLGVAASWLVQVGIDLYRFFSSAFQGQHEDNDVDQTNQVGVLGQKVFIATVRCTSSLIFASIGAGIGATLIRPSLGQWVGCALGDLGGPIIVAFCADKLFQVKL